MKYGMASLLIILSLAGMAQEKKQLTLEDLIPGGETFYKFRPENIYGMQWWDNSLAYYNADKSALVVKQPQALAKEKLIFLKEVNDALQKAGLGRLAALYSVSYPQEMKGMLISAPKYYALYNEGVVTWMMNADNSGILSANSQQCACSCRPFFCCQLDTHPTSLASDVLRMERQADPQRHRLVMPTDR